MKIKDEPFPDPKCLCARLSDGACAIIARALKKPAAERCADCGEMAKVLRGHLASLGVAGEATLADAEAGATKLSLVSVAPPAPKTMTLIAQAALGGVRPPDVRLAARATGAHAVHDDAVAEAAGEARPADVVDKQTEVDALGDRAGGGRGDARAKGQELPAESPETPKGTSRGCQVGLLVALLCAVGVAALIQRGCGGGSGRSPTLTLDLGGGVTMELVLVPAGSLMVRDQRATIGQPFYLGKYEVTQSQYERVAGINPSKCRGPDSPVESVSWNEMVEFCRKLSQRTGKSVRLPTESEWEYACRAGSTSRFCFGDSVADLMNYAWYAGNAEGETHPVGRKLANAWGFHDMHGNVMEWCADEWVGEGAQPGRPPMCGGYYDALPERCTADTRFANAKSYRNERIGFRVIVEQGTGAGQHTGRTDGASTESGDTAGAVSSSPTAARPRGHTLKLGGSVTMELLLIPAGEFMMGSPASERGRKSDEGPRHRVRITQAFYMGKYEVTQSQYRRVVGKNPSKYRALRSPVESASWNDASAFCQKLSQMAGRRVRLPTEAEWEYACRAGTTTVFSFGTDWTQLRHHAVIRLTGTFYSVGSRKPNAWGLHDMHGGVLEWCSDRYDSRYYRSSPTSDPSGPTRGRLRVARGGGWAATDGATCRSAARHPLKPTDRYPAIGFRVVVEVAGQ